MSLPYFPFYPDDYEADTAHLNLEEDGAYFRLLRLCWRSPGCRIPADPKWIARKMRVTDAKFRKVIAPIIEEFFVTAAGFVYSPAIEKWLGWCRRSTPRPWVPLDIQRAVRTRDGERCRYCGATDGPFHLDHVHPFALGGEHSIENLVVSCAPCNWSKGSKTLDEWGGSRG